MTKILIAGGAGRLGSEITRLLAEEGFQVKVFSRGTRFQQFLYYPKALRALIKPTKGDLTNYQSIKQHMEDVDGVFHLSALIQGDCEKIMKLNVDGTQNIIEAVEETNPENPLLFASTVAVYGRTNNQGPLISEDYPRTATDAYSESKILAEDLIEKSGLKYVILRMSAIAIPEPLMLPPTLPFTADENVEFVHRDDAARAFIKAFKNDRAYNQIFNIAGGKTWRMTGREYATKLCEAMNTTLMSDFQQEYSCFYWYNISKAKFILKFHPTPFNEFLNALEQKSRLGGPAEPFVAT